MQFPDYPVSAESGPDRRPEVDVMQFGDGYTQTSASLPTHITARYRARFTNRALADIDAIDAFLTERAGHKTFTFTAPGEAAPRTWTCEDWSRERVDDDVHSLTAVFEEET